MSSTILGPVDLERVFRAVNKITERACRAGAVLDAAGIPYAIIGGNAVANWVSRVDESSVRFTRDVDMLLRRTDLESATRAFTAAGFVRRHVAGIEMFLDGPNSKAGDAVHILFAGERVRPDDPCAAPDVSESERGKDYAVLSLEALVRMKLTSNRDKDRTHLRDMIELGLIDANWCPRYPSELATRLQHLFDTPGG